MMMQAGTKLDPINKASPLKSTPSAHGKKSDKVFRSNAELQLDVTNWNPKFQTQL